MDDFAHFLPWLSNELYSTGIKLCMVECNFNENNGGAVVFFKVCLD